MRLQRAFGLLAAASSATCALTLSVAGTSASGGFSVLEESEAVVVRPVSSTSFGSSIVAQKAAPSASLALSSDAAVEDVVGPPSEAALALLDGADTGVLGKHLRKAYKGLQDAAKRLSIAARRSNGESLMQRGVSASQAAMMQDRMHNQDAERLEKKVRKALGKAQSALGTARNELGGDMVVSAEMAVDARTALMDGTYAMSLFNAGVDAIRDGRSDDLGHRISELKVTLSKMDKDIVKVS